MSSETPGPLRPGPLRNGNPRGNPHASPSPRCGARTRAGGACRQPAMANGRCRLHGGLSTGPRTEAGRARIRAAATKHGGYSGESRAALRCTDAFIAETRAVLASLRKIGAPAEVVAARRPRGNERKRDREKG